VRQIRVTRKKWPLTMAQPDLMTRQGTLQTQQRINDLESARNTSVDIPLLHRYIRNYAKKETKDRFYAKLNSSHNGFNDLNNLLTTLAGHFKEDERLDDLNYVNNIYSDFVDKMNARIKVDSDLYNFIINLKATDFR